MRSSGEWSCCVTFYKAVTTASAPTDNDRRTSSVCVMWRICRLPVIWVKFQGSLSREPGQSRICLGFVSRWLSALPHSAAATCPNHKRPPSVIGWPLCCAEALIEDIVQSGLCGFYRRWQRDEARALGCLTCGAVKGQGRGLLLAVVHDRFQPSFLHCSLLGSSFGAWAHCFVISNYAPDLGPSFGENKENRKGLRFFSTGL